MLPVPGMLSPGERGTVAAEHKEPHGGGGEGCGGPAGRSRLQAALG